MNKAVIGIVVVALLVVGYMLANEFGQKSAAPEVVSTAQTVTQPADVQQSEEAQINREIASEAQNTMLSREYLVSCAPCHNKDGSGPVGASIKGMTKEELTASLMAYKNGSAKTSLMVGLMENISDEEIMRLSEEISKF